MCNPVPQPVKTEEDICHRELACELKSGLGKFQERTEVKISHNFKQFWLRFYLI